MTTHETKRSTWPSAAADLEGPPEEIVDRLAGLLPQEQLGDALEGLEPEEIAGPAACWASWPAGKNMLNPTSTAKVTDVW